ncbi:Sporulation protein YtfJ (Spore_YtfJ) [Saccharomonospora marina XMU15]|uniref:Sporulation protein YtfJ (Spore_YtfJ) n=1 Tax=Saccharomonospora marina XMU15 TaxID=882083 RepID=H5X1P9_9PSEU|nr:sporulation protein [Saccharomonospora marina]EHR50912.1 Sporulation protein YtfJ (Spore_YtfJ) [Saccharomonospora marina XMU15]
MAVGELFTVVKDAISVRKVYSEPIERDGVVVVTAASVGGGGGAGHSDDQKGQQGEGGGFGLGGAPTGAYVLKDGNVRWVPAVDVNRMFMLVAAVVMTFLFTRARIAGARAKAQSAS